MQEDILKQKVRISWAEEGDFNSKYFYSVVKEKKGEDLIYTELRTIKEGGYRGIKQSLMRLLITLVTFSLIPTVNLSILDCVEPLVTEEDNHTLYEVPEEALQVQMASSDKGYHQKRSL